MKDHNTPDFRLAASTLYADLAIPPWASKREAPAAQAGSCRPRPGGSNFGCRTFPRAGLGRHFMLSARHGLVTMDRMVAEQRAIDSALPFRSFVIAVQHGGRFVFGQELPPETTAGRRTSLHQALYRMIWYIKYILYLLNRVGLAVNLTPARIAAGPIGAPLLPSWESVRMASRRGLWHVARWKRSARYRAVDTITASRIVNSCAQCAKIGLFALSFFVDM